MTLLIAGQQVSYQDVHETKVAFCQRLLQQHHRGELRPRCLCVESGVEMVVRKLSGRYVLARMPNSGPRHHPECVSFDLAEGQSGRGGYTESAIVTDASGATRVNLDAKLSLTTETLRAEATKQVKERPDQSSKKRAQTSLLGLLHHLWDAGKLNRWYPRMAGKRGWWTVKNCIAELAPTTLIKRTPLSDQLWVPEIYRRDTPNRREDFIDFMRRATRRDGAVQHLALLLGDVHAVTQTEFGARLTINDLRDVAFWFNRDAYATLSRRFMRALHVLNRADRSDRVVGLFVIGPSAKHDDQFYVRDACLMHVSEQWVPLDSSYEGRIERGLVDQGRAFLKPLRYDANQGDVFPDFVLLDTGDTHVPMEIFGFTGDPAYEQRKREKIEYYERAGEPFWVWDVAQNPTRWPVFPSPVLKKLDRAYHYNKQRSETCGSK